MQKGNQIYVYPSLSVTPQCVHLKSKSISGHRKPPTHNKKPQGDLKILKASKKSKTSSFTPKPVKLNMFDRGFHNSNLSDTDVSTKYIDLTYTNNKLRGSIFSKNELSKLKDSKAPQKNIDKIIRKSLIKAKNLKLSQDKINKESRIEKEIKKNEISLQNKQIRIQNLLKYKKRKKSKKKSNEGIEKQLEILPKFVKVFGTKKKRSTNSVDFYHSETRDRELLELVERRKGQKSRDESLNYIERVAAEISKANQLEKYRKLEAEKEADYLRGKEFDKVERNISFIEEGSDLDLFSVKSELKNEFLQSHEKNKENSACLIQRFFRKYLARKYLKNLARRFSICTQGPVCVKGHTKKLKVESKSVFKLTPKKKIFGISKQPSFSLFRNKAKQEKLSIVKEAGIFLLSKGKKELFMHKEKSFSIVSKAKEGLLSSSQVLYEQAAMNLAQVNIIEQLRLEELSLIEKLTRSHLDQGTYLTSVHNKYKVLITHLKSTLKRLQSPFLDTISAQSFSNIKKFQQIFEDDIKNHIKSSLTINFCIPVSSGLDLESQLSSDLSSDEIEALAVNYSNSTSQLLADSSQGTYRDSKEISDINVISLTKDQFESNRDLPSLPSFSLAQMDSLQDIPNSEIRILTSTDSILDYARDLLSKLDFPHILQEISKPIERSPLMALEKINNKPLGTCVESVVYDYPKILNADFILKEDTDCEIDSTVRELGKADYFHKKMIIVVIDYLLQVNRPFGLMGSPMPWQDSNPQHKRNLNPEALKTKVLKELEIFSLFQIGRIFNEDIMNVSSGIDNEIVRCLREEKLEKAVLFEAVIEEEKWTYYEFEETQTKLDLADLVVEILAGEVIFVCNQ